jgi:hypothetical protein
VIFGEAIIKSMIRDLLLDPEPPCTRNSGLRTDTVAYRRSGSLVSLALTQHGNSNAIAKGNSHQAPHRSSLITVIVRGRHARHAAAETMPSPASLHVLYLTKQFEITSSFRFLPMPHSAGEHAGECSNVLGTAVRRLLIARGDIA